MGEWRSVSGPAFIGLFSAGLMLGVVAFYLLRKLIGMMRTRAGRVRLDEYSLAYLGAGRVRVAQAVVAELVERGALRVMRGGFVAVADPALVRSSDQAVLVKAITVLDFEQYRNVHRVVAMLTSLSPIADIGHQLRADGMFSGRLAMLAKRLCCCLPLCAVLAIGALRAITAPKGPVGFLYLLLMLGLITMLIIALMPQPRRSFAGNAELRAAKARSVRSGRAAALVAAGGLDAFPDATVSAAFLAAPVLATAGGGAGPGDNYLVGGLGGCGGGSN